MCATLQHKNVIFLVDHLILQVFQKVLLILAYYCIKIIPKSRNRREIKSCFFRPHQWNVGSTKVDDSPNLSAAIHIQLKAISDAISTLLPTPL